MSTENNTTIDLLSPVSSYRKNYAHQLQQTIYAYSTSMVVLGEAVQNAIDAVCEANKPQGVINISIDFDLEQIIVQDNGNGFPKDISLLYLGGGKKSDKKLKGKVGVGIKVTLFCSQHFSIRSRSSEGSWKVDIENAYKFQEIPELRVPKDLPVDDTPLEELGTKISYRFPSERKLLKEFIEEVIDTSLPKGIDKEFGKIINNSNTGFPSPIAALLTAFLRRYSYVGDVLASMSKQKNYPTKGIKINFCIKCSDPKNYFEKPRIAEIFGEEREQNFVVYPEYFSVEDSLQWIPKGKRKPSIFNDKLGRGGSNLVRTDGFNILRFDSREDYESLITNKRGNLPDDIDSYRRYLFPKINGIYLAIGRIPEFELYLPGGSRRLISCNGIVTSHNIDLTRGQNQAYVRCFDLVIDVDAELNYGKTHLINTQLVKWIRYYINDAYVHVIQTAAGAWVGKLPNDGDDEDQEGFLDKADLGLPKYMTQKVPRDENDVIGLFFEMAGQGLFPDYKVFGLSQKNKYDCGAVIKREKDTEDIFKPTDNSKLRIVEFKVHASEVIRDFDRGSKDSKEVDLVIAWDEGDYENRDYARDYAIYDIDQSKAFSASPKRIFPGASKFIYDTRQGSEVQILLLSDIVFQIKSQHLK